MSAHHIAYPPITAKKAGTTCCLEILPQWRFSLKLGLSIQGLLGAIHNFRAYSSLLVLTDSFSDDSASERPCYDAGAAMASGLSMSDSQMPADFLRNTGETLKNYPEHGKAAYRLGAFILKYIEVPSVRLPLQPLVPGWHARPATAGPTGIAALAIALPAMPAGTGGRTRRVQIAPSAMDYSQISTIFCKG